MSEHENNQDFRITSIPPIFYSDLTSNPFNKCVKCEKELLESGESYMIEKAIREDKEMGVKNTIFEYAMCMECASAMSKKLSQSSMMNLAVYYQKNVDFNNRRRSLENSKEVGDWINSCLIHGEPPGKSGEYQIYAECMGNNIVLGDYPFMIRGEALEELIELLSAETLDELDNFKDDITSGPPEYREIVKSGPRVIE